MTVTLWIAQAAQSGSVSCQASGDAVERTLADLTTALEASGLSLILVALVCVNSLLGFRVYASSCNSCGCGTCRIRSVRQTLLGVALNAVAFCLSSWRYVDTIDPQGHSMSGAGNSFLSGIILLSFIATLAFGVAGINALTDAPRIGAQCPLAHGDVGDSATSTEADVMVQWEDHAVGCGGAWELELSSALMKK